MSSCSNAPILLVDDDHDDADLTLLALKLNDIHNEVIIARDGREALEILLQNNIPNKPFIPALVLLDINMPGMDGMEMLEQLRNNEVTRLLPVVMLTTSTSPDDIKKSYNLGANSYITKPSDFDQFSKIIGGIGKYWLNLNVVTSPAAEQISI
jgi:two-component system, response regulator